MIDGNAITFTGGGFDGWYKAMQLQKVADYAITGTSFTNLSSDGINIVSTARGRLANLTMTAFQHVPCVPPNCIHSDGVQGWTLPGFPPNTDILIEDVTLDVAWGQCIFEPSVGVTMTVQRARLNCGQTGINLTQAGPSTVQGVILTTAAGATFQSRIVTSPNVVRCSNTTGPWATKPGLADQPCLVTP